MLQDILLQDLSQRCRMPCAVGLVLPQKLSKWHLVWGEEMPSWQACLSLTVCEQHVGLPRSLICSGCGSTGSNSAGAALWHGSASHCSRVGSIARAHPQQKLVLLSITGDHFYKRNKNLPPEEQMISALPDIKVLTINDDHDFMVIACDGIW